MKKWSEEAWDVARPTYLKNHRTSVRRRAARGTLAADKFLFYLRQDSLYLAHYSRVLTHRFPSYREGAHRGFHSFCFGRHRGRGGAARLLPERRRTGSRRDQPDMSALHLGTASPGHSPVEVEAAAVLPCFWVYQQVGQQIIARQQGSGIPMHNGSKPTPTLLHRSDYPGHRNLRCTGRKNRAGNPAG